jgi:hypothetical protein
VADYKLTIIEQNNMTDAIEGSDISLVYKENSDIEDALKKQNAFLWPQAFFSKSSAEVTIEVATAAMRADWRRPNREFWRQVHLQSPSHSL